MRHLLQLLALAAVLGGAWLLYAGYQRSNSLAGKTDAGLAQMASGIDGSTRIPTHRWMYAGGTALIVGGAWWLLRGQKSVRG
jgi:hypothetical protein